MAYRLLALDIDGTLLARDGSLTPATASAVARAAAAGIRPVLCTGRRYRTAKPIAEALGLRGPIVCNSGALTKNLDDGATLRRTDLDAPMLAEVLSIFDALGEPAVCFTDRPDAEADFVVAAHPSGRPLLDEYVARNARHAEVDPGWAQSLAAEPRYHACAVGEWPSMLALEVALHAALPGRVQTFVQKSPAYAGTMCEVLAAGASKWSAVLSLAAGWGIDPSEIVAVGDDMNDLPMIAGAGLGVAMGHAPEAVLRAADHVAGTHDEQGLCAFIEEYLLKEAGRV